MPSNALSHHWPGKYDGSAITVFSTGQRLTLVEVEPLTFAWRPAGDASGPPSSNVTEPGTKCNQAITGCASQQNPPR
jgi:hypothetical protein